MTRRKSLVSLSLVGVLLSTSYAFAECAARPERVCVLANHDGPIVIATVLGPVEPDVRPDMSTFEWRVHIDRSFRGSARGTVVVFVTHGDLSSPGRLPIGGQFLFYLTPTRPDGDDGMSASIGCGYSIALQSAAKSELTFLARLGRHANDGHIVGEVVGGHPLANPPARFGGVRVTASTRSRSYSAVTAADGTFDIAGLPSGSYRLSAAVPGAHDQGTDDDPIVLQPHGCSESDIEVTAPSPAEARRREATAFPLPGRPGAEPWRADRSLVPTDGTSAVIQTTRPARAPSRAR